VGVGVAAALALTSAMKWGDFRGFSSATNAAALPPAPPPVPAVALQAKPAPPSALGKEAVKGVQKAPAGVLPAATVPAAPPAAAAQAKPAAAPAPAPAPPAAGAHTQQLALGFTLVRPCASH
jgi:hypothetical protein